MGLGTMAGGVRIIRTMGTKIIDLKPIHGFAAETGGRDHDPGGLAPGDAGLDDARHQRGDHGRRVEPAGLGGALGGDGANPVGVGADHPDQRGDGLGLLRDYPRAIRTLSPPSPLTSAMRPLTRGETPMDEPGRAGLRLGLGLAPMAGATVGACLLLKSGVSGWTLAVAGATGLLTVVSRWWPREARRPPGPPG